MYTAGCNFEWPKFLTCLPYEYDVEDVCLLNYCSKDMPCYAGQCDPNLNSCVNITTAKKPLPAAANQVISFGYDPLGLREKAFSPTPLIIILMVAGGVIGLAIVGCLIRTIVLGAKSSVQWASSGHRLESYGEEKHEDRDRDSFGNHTLNRKLPTAVTSEPRVDLIQTPIKLSGPSASLTSIDSPHSSPTSSPLASSFTQSVASQQTRVLHQREQVMTEQVPVGRTSTSGAGPQRRIGFGSVVL
ncbi:hypothetical protein BG004_001078 [Podila humilis]|nr:hypothetical protein BG004_001078 [Podila humilis]